MGYRSDVSVVFYTRNEEAMAFAAIKLWFDENYPHREAVVEWGAEIETGVGWVMVTYQDVKWYSGYDHVQNVQRALDSFDVCFDANDKDLAAWEFARVGENEDDIETERSGYCDYRLNVRREIVLD